MIPPHPTRACLGYRSHHRSHAACGRVCVPAFLHDEFRRALGTVDADATLRAWYDQVLDQLGSAPVAEDPIRFWRTRFTAWVQRTASQRAVIDEALARVQQRRGSR